MKARRGFTIVEVLATALLLSLLCVLALKSFYRNLDTASLDSAARDINNAAGYARLIALESQRPCLLWIDLSQNCYWLEAKPPEKIPFREAEEPETVVIDNPYEKPRYLPVGVHFNRVKTVSSQPLSTQRVAIRFQSDNTADTSLIQMNSEQDDCTLLIRPYNAETELYFNQVDRLPYDTIDLDETGQTGDSVFRIW